MTSTINLFYQLFKQQGLKYMLFRGSVIVEKKTGLFKRKYKTNNIPLKIPDYNQWLKDKLPFFIDDRTDIQIPNDDYNIEGGKRILAGELPYFSSQWYPHDSQTWLTNPLTGYVYELKHFSDIPEFVAEHGDIKYLWEASRFGWLYDVMKYDLTTKNNSDEFVFDQIESWIDNNPLNLGPNYICSQEIALRVLNWIYALHFYSYSQYLTNELWNKIVISIAGQMDHVYQNRKFALIAVRNNHTLTEMLGLYVVGSMFSFLPEALRWAVTGKNHFAEEVVYQIAEDGSYIQQSFNYQRVVVQLLTWALKLGELWENKFSPKTYTRAKSCLIFLQSFSQPENGFSPNYGANDGALFFPFSNNDYRDYRPQLNALADVLRKPQLNDVSDSPWFGIEPNKIEKHISLSNSITEFESGGYYLMRSGNLFGFIRCNSNIHRPSHADNLHFDLWHRGENILMDGGSYLYNTTSENTRYFFGSASHNTVMLGGCDQMEKGPRFVWLNWSKKINAGLTENDGCFEFQGEIKAFSHVGRNIHHKREVRMSNNDIIINDRFTNKPGQLKLRQGWLVNEAWLDRILFTVTDEGDSTINPIITDGWISNHYGIKKKCKQVEFATLSNQINTIISLRI